MYMREDVSIVTTSPMRSRASSSVATARRRAGWRGQPGASGAPSPLTVREAVHAETDLKGRLCLKLALEELRAEHNHIRLGVERLRRSKEADALESKSLLAHDFNDIK